MTQSDPPITLSTLDRADGSATYSANGYKVICGVNGPVEVQRRDELPEEAAVEVNLRPSSGVGGVRERHLESILHSTLRHIILTTAHPRTLIQVTLQVVSSQEGESQIGGLPQAASNIDLLPVLFQATTLALLSASIPLRATLTSVLIAIDSNGTIRANPTGKDFADALSEHVLGFSSHGELIVVESEGEFSMEEWCQIYHTAKGICLADGDGKGEGADEDAEMEKEKGEDLQDRLRKTVQEKIEKDTRWKREAE